MAKKAKKAAPKRPAVDSRGRLIGKRAHRTPPGEGLIKISVAERAALRSVAQRAVESNVASAFARAMALEVGEVDFAPSDQVQSLAMSLSQARRRKELGGRVFDYGTEPLMFERGRTHDVLWFMRVK